MQNLSCICRCVESNHLGTQRSSGGTMTAHPPSAMRTPLLPLIAIAGLLFQGRVVLAHEAHQFQAVTPESELRTPPVGAPSITQKISVKALGSIDLSREFTALNKRILRSRRITIKPGGSVAWHEHQHRPGVAYLIEGTLTEVRDDGSGVRSIRRHAGEAVFESTGVLHGWKNDSNQAATAIVIDLIPNPQP